jgi:hypothetical protein
MALFSRDPFASNHLKIITAQLSSLGVTRSK